MDLKTIAGIVGTLIFLSYAVFVYNKLIRLRYAVRRSWSDIDVHLKKRYELLPNLVESVKGYTAHESDTLTEVTRLRSAAMKAETPQEKAKADNMLTQTLKSLFALAEAYPNLKADEHFKQLLSNMREIDDNIEHARRYYNAAVQEYNVAAAVFPTNVVASAFAFTPEELFALGDEETERQPVLVSFK